MQTSCLQGPCNDLRRHNIARYLEKETMEEFVNNQPLVCALCACVLDPKDRDFLFNNLPMRRFAVDGTLHTASVVKAFSRHASWEMMKRYGDSFLCLDTINEREDLTFRQKMKLFTRVRRAHLLNMNIHQLEDHRDLNIDVSTLLNIPSWNALDWFPQHKIRATQFAPECMENIDWDFILSKPNLVVEVALSRIVPMEFVLKYPQKDWIQEFLNHVTLDVLNVLPSPCTVVDFHPSVTTEDLIKRTNIYLGSVAKTVPWTVIIENAHRFVTCPGQLISRKDFSWAHAVQMGVFANLVYFCKWTPPPSDVVFANPHLPWPKHVLQFICKDESFFLDNNIPIWVRHRYIMSKFPDHQNEEFHLQLCRMQLKYDVPVDQQLYNAWILHEHPKFCLVEVSRHMDWQWNWDAIRPLLQRKPWLLSLFPKNIIGQSNATLELLQHAVVMTNRIRVYYRIYRYSPNSRRMKQQFKEMEMQYKIYQLTFPTSLHADVPTRKREREHGSATQNKRICLNGESPSFK